jgi:hypothetical protein
MTIVQVACGELGKCPTLHNVHPQDVTVWVLEATEAEITLVNG